MRQRLSITADPGRAREVARQAIRAAAQTKDNPADLVNVALEELVRARLELSGYSTLDELAAGIRHQVNTAVLAGIAARMTPADVQAVDGLLEVDPVRRRRGFDLLKTVAPPASAQRFKDHLKYLAWLDSLGAADRWLAGVPPAKVIHFAGEARVTDVADLRRYAPQRRRALTSAPLHTARMRAPVTRWPLCSEVLGAVISADSGDDHREYPYRRACQETAIARIETTRIIASRSSLASSAVVTRIGGDSNGPVLHGPEVPRCRVMAVSRVVGDFRSDTSGDLVDFRPHLVVCAARRKDPHVGPARRGTSG